MINVDTTQQLGQMPTPAKGRVTETVKEAWERSGVLAPKAAASPADTLKDTVTLSEGGQKIVNLGRGQELADQVRTAPADETFGATLRKASEDIFRIARLFGETLRASFNSWR
ncbi:MAG: hypothetical protein NUV50_07515 [Rhodospirillales bacterium]|nr:hypothetical protein [Rhodospirillales bacterium]